MTRLPQAATRLVLLVVVLGGACGIARSQGSPAEAPVLTGVSPPAVTRGGTAEVLLSGQRLEGASGVLCRYSAFPTQLPPRERGVSASMVRSVSEGQAAALLSLTAEAPPGLHELRLVTARGVTNPVYLLVLQHPETPAVEPNNTPAQATPLTLPAVAAGTIESAEDRDWYRFEARAGQTLVLEVNGLHRHSPPPSAQQGLVYLDSYLELLDASGRELASSDDELRLDSFLAWTFPTAGTYLVCLRDTLYRGRADFHYRLTIGAVPYLTGVVPPGGQRGTRGAVTLFGYNLDDTGTATRVRRGVTFSETPGVDELRVTTAAGTSNAVAVISDALPEAPEEEPNNTIPDGTALVLPATASGKFDAPGDVDVFRFQGQGGQRLILEVTAARLGSPVDTALVLRSRAGQLVGQNDDGPEGSDSRLEVTLPATDEYALVVRNQLRGGGGPEYFYRVGIRPPQPSFAVQVQQEGRDRQGGAVKVPVDGLAVPHGSQVEFEVQLQRREGQDGDVTLALGTPQAPAALRAVRLEGLGPPTVRAGQNSLRVRLTAPRELEPGTYLGLALRCRGLAGTQPVTVSRPLWLTVMPP
jgi:hypothetical protein